MEKKKNFRLRVSENDPDVAYLALPGHPGAGLPNIVKKQISLADQIEGYVGPSVYLDFDATGLLIGIEILA